jgi:hypothetical protein
MVGIDLGLRIKFIAPTLGCLEIDVRESDNLHIPMLGCLQMILRDTAATDQRELVGFGAAGTTRLII